MVSVFGNVRKEHVRDDPYAHVCTTQALDPDYYRELSANFPDIAGISGAAWEKNNTLILLSTLQCLAGGMLAPIWRDFIEYHHSTDFFRDVVGVFGDAIRAAHPDLEGRLGKPLESMTVAARHSGIDADVFIDCQFGINTPVSAPSRVRGFHVDKPNKITNALIYMPVEDDDSVGGHFQIARFRDRPRFQDVSVPDDAVEIVDEVAYRANTMISMVNTPFALHAVSPRMPTPHPRRYVNILAELRDPLFDLGPYQDRQTPWALMRR